jgi:hypothetical protein
LQLIFGRFKLKKQKLKKILPPCGTVLRTCHRAARRQVPDAVLIALAREMDSCRRSPRRQGLNAVRYGGRSLMPRVTAAGANPRHVGCTFVEKFDSTYYFSKIMTN